MDKWIIGTENAPQPIGPYSQAVLAGHTLYISGQVAKDAATGNLDTSSIENETRKVMENIRAILTTAGFDFSHVVKSTVFLSDMKLFQGMNAVYGSYFTDNFPARETVAVMGLPLGVNVEISMIACK